MNAAVVGVAQSPSGMIGTVVDVLWTRPIDGETFDTSSLMVGGQQPSEVWVDEQDLFVIHLIFDKPIDTVGGTVQIVDTVRGGPGCLHSNTRSISGIAPLFVRLPRVSAALYCRTHPGSRR